MIDKYRDGTQIHRGTTTASETETWLGRKLIPKNCPRPAITFSSHVGVCSIIKSKPPIRPSC